MGVNAATTINPDAAADLAALDQLLSEIAPEEASAEIPAVTEITAPSSDEISAAATAAVEVTEAKTKKPKREKKPKAEKTEKKAVEKKPKAEKPKAEKPKKEPKPPRVFFGKNKIGRLEHKLGASTLNEFLTLTATEADLQGDELAAAQQKAREMFAAMGVKVQNRATNLIEFCSGKIDRLNGISATAFKLLATDGKIVTGDKGNLHQTLLLKPYSPNAARAMGNNTVAMLRHLKLIHETGPQTFGANGESVLLGIVAAKLSMTFTETEAAPAAVVAPVAETAEPESVVTVESVSEELAEVA